MSAGNRSTIQSIDGPDVSEGIVWFLCGACGHWARGQSRCTACGWPRTRSAAASDAQDGAVLRFLLETEVRSDRSWRLAAVRSARMPEFALDEALLRSLRDEKGPFRHLVAASAGSDGQRLPIDALERFRVAASRVITEMLNGRLAGTWPAPRKPSSAAVAVSMRCVVLDPELGAMDEARDWLHAVPFDTAVADVAARLNDGDVNVASSHAIGMGGDGDLISVTLTAPCELLVEACAVECQVKGNSTLLWRSGPFAAVYRSMPLTLPTFRLRANAIRGLAVADVGSAEVQVFVRGREEPFRQKLAVGELPQSQHVVDLFLDLGSTTTKWALRFHGGDTTDEHDQETDRLVRAWGIPEYRKSEFIADPTGEKWYSWMSLALPALRHWVGEEHAAFLADVHVALPTTEGLDVERLAEALSTDEVGSLSRSAQEHLVCSGTIRLAPEHAYLARHYVDVLRVLQGAAKAYSIRHDKRRAKQLRRQERWDSKVEEHWRYQKRNPFIRIFLSEPERPSGSRPRVEPELADSEAWMLDLNQRSEQLNRVLLLDAGGMSLDVAVLEEHRLVKELSYSAGACGGEALSRQIGRRQSGPRGTRYKAQLALRWRDAPNQQDAQQQEYAAKTRALYEPEIGPLLKTLGDRWKKAPVCVILLTGGGSRNPHLHDLVCELADDAGLHPNVADASSIQELLRLARAVDRPLPELESETVRRFEDTQTWSARRERQPWARYDKFAVVGGMLVPDGKD